MKILSRFVNVLVSLGLSDWQNYLTIFGWIIRCLMNGEEYLVYKNKYNIQNYMNYWAIKLISYR